MPKESAPQGDGMNRRDVFKKISAMAGGFLMAESTAEAQTPQLDNRIQQILLKADDVKINFPENPETITPQIEAIISAIHTYRAVYMGGQLLNENTLDGGKQTMERAKIATQEDIVKAKKNIWIELKKYTSSLPDFSDNAFYETLALQVPQELAKYGIYSRGRPIFMQENDKAGNPVSFIFTEFGFTFLDVSKVKHEEVAEWGRRTLIDIIYIKGAHQNPNEKGVEQNPTSPGENGFRNVMIFEQELRRKFEATLKVFNDLKIPIIQSAKGEFVATRQENLVKLNTWQAATEVLMAKLLERMRQPTYEEFERQTVSHETRHLIDRLEGDLHKAWPFKLTTKAAEQDLRDTNFKIHDELNPSISELRYGPNREFALLYFTSNSNEVKSGAPSFLLSKTSQWIMRNMVDLVSKETKRYGIKISEEKKVSVANQIVSQLDVLLDRPELFNGLCEDLVRRHKQNLTENLLVQKDLALGPSSLYKIGIPTAVIGAGAAAIEILRRRKNKITAEKGEAPMSRQARRAQEREKGKKPKNNP